MLRGLYGLFKPAGVTEHNTGLWQRLNGLALREWGIAHGSLILMAAFIASAALGVVRQMLFNAQFGAGMEADAYYAAFRLPEALASLVAGGTLANALIPVLLGVERTRGTVAAERLVSLTLTTLLVAVAPVVIVCALLAPWFVQQVLAPGFDAATAQLTVTLTRIMLCELCLMVAYGVLSALLLARNQFVLPALAIALHNISIIGGILAARFVPGLGVYGPALGVLTDSLVQVLVLVPGLLRSGYRYRPLWQPRNQDLRAGMRLLVPRGLSGMVNYAGLIADTAYASLAAQAATLAALNNAYLLLGVPLRLLGFATAQAAAPRLAAQAANHEWHQMQRTLRRVTLVVGALTVPVVLLTLLGGRQVIGVLFERGRFDAAAADLTYLLLAVYIVALPAYVVVELCTVGLLALRDARTPLLTNSLQLGGRIALTGALLPSLGAVAIPLALAVTALLEALVLGAVLLRNIGVLQRH